MRFRKLLEVPCGLKELYFNLELSSPLTRELLLDSKQESSQEKIEELYCHLNEVVELFKREQFQGIERRVKIELTRLKDIRATLLKVERGEVVDDIELFEIKELSLINQTMAELIAPFTIKAVTLPNLSTVAQLLDPEGSGISSFYIYDSYSEELREIRKIIAREKEYSQELIYKSQIIEQKIRVDLSKKIKKEVDNLFSSLENLSKLDLLLAKSELMGRLQLTIPKISNGEKIYYRALFNPAVKEVLAKEGKEYQPIDIELNRRKPLLITGANMGGKSVTLKSLALAQLLFQHGFPLPAKEAAVSPVSTVLISTGDHQDYTKGLSSFTAEIKALDHIIGEVRSGKEHLILIDEPARTTNPTEGEALAASLLKILFIAEGFTAVTTHYTIENREVDRYRVKGFSNGVMDYTLIRDESQKTPAEALTIAESLGVDTEWINLAKSHIEIKKE